MAKYTDPTDKSLYSRYRSIKRRCYCPRNRSYKYYGGRGIYMCDEWLHSFKAFKQWALSNGFAINLTIDRIDPDGPYSPENCQWIAPEENWDTKRKLDRPTSTKKLTKETVLFIHSHPDISSPDLARMLGVRRSTVWNVRSGATWPEYHPDIESYERGGALLKRVSFTSPKVFLHPNIKWNSERGRYASLKAFNYGVPDFVVFGIRCFALGKYWWFNAIDCMLYLKYSIGSIKTIKSFTRTKPMSFYRKIITLCDSGYNNMYYFNATGLSSFGKWRGLLSGADLARKLLAVLPEI